MKFIPSVNAGTYSGGGFLDDTADAAYLSGLLGVQSPFSYALGLIIGKWIPTLPPSCLYVLKKEFWKKDIVECYVAPRSLLLLM